MRRRLSSHPIRGIPEAAVLGLFLWLLLTAAVGAAEPTQEQRALQLAAVVDAFHSTGQFNGSLTAVVGGEEIFSAGVGPADIESGRANGPQTRYVSASVAKVMTATAVLQLVEEERLALDDTLATFFSELEGSPAAVVTVDQLLRHRSGLVRDFTEFLFDDAPTPFDASTVVEVVRDHAPLLYEPGRSTAYSNAGYFLLSEIVARVDGRSFEQALTERVFRPAGMEHTTFLLSDGDDPDLARPYSTALVTELSPGTPGRFDGSQNRGAGNVITTTGDLIALGRAIHRGELLSVKSRDMMFALDENNEFGWETHELSGRRVAIATGASGDGYLSMLLWLVGEDTFVSFLTNHDGLGRRGFLPFLFALLSAVTEPGAAPEPAATPLRTALLTLFDSGEAEALAYLRTLDLSRPPAARAGAGQLVGPPDAPVGETPLAWAARRPNAGAGWLRLEYAGEIAPSAVRWYVTQVPGATRRIAMYGGDGEVAEVDVGVAERGRTENGVITLTVAVSPDFAVERVELFLDTAAVRGWTQIDAVALLDSRGEPHWALSAAASSSAAEEALPTPHDLPTAEKLATVADNLERAGRRGRAALVRRLIRAGFAPGRRADDGKAARSPRGLGNGMPRAAVVLATN